MDRSRANPSGESWWQTRWLAALVVLAAAVPLIGPAIPPLTDVPGHIGRYYVMLHGDAAPTLRESYAFEWRLVGNLGADLIVWLLGQVMPVELATKLTVIGIAMLTALGIVTLARTIHGRLPPTALLAIPLVYAFPFQFGFLNYWLAVALGLLALALWLRLGEAGRTRLRAAVFVPIAFALFVAHLSGWAVFGLMAAGAEFARLRIAGEYWARAAIRTVAACSVLALPVVITLVGSRDPQAVTYDWFQWSAKTQWLLSLLRERFETYDLISLILLVAATYLGGRKFGLDPRLALPALLCAIAFVLLPRVLMNGTYADMRLAPVALILALLAIRTPATLRVARGLVIASIAFALVRLSVTTFVFREVAEDQEAELAALAAIPTGASVLALVSRPCESWATRRLVHLPSLAIARRQAFVNSQWAIRGQQLISVRRTDVGAFEQDPSQIVSTPGCQSVTTRFGPAIAGFSRAAFTHVWTIGIPARRLTPDLTLVWRNHDSAVYAVKRQSGVAGTQPRP